MWLQESFFFIIYICSKCLGYKKWRGFRWSFSLLMLASPTSGIHVSTCLSVFFLFIKTFYQYFRCSLWFPPLWQHLVVLTRKRAFFFTAKRNAARIVTTSTHIICRSKSNLWTPKENFFFSSFSPSSPRRHFLDEEYESLLETIHSSREEVTW